MIAEQSPADRLVLSRERLRRALSGAGAGGEAGAQARAARGAAPWWDELRALPGAAIVIEAAQLWWAKHPLRATVLAAIDAVQVVVHPLAQRHPFGLVLGAMMVGGLLAWQRPWRWVFTTGLWAGLLPQLLLSTLAAQALPPRTPEQADRA